ncbi:MAG: hypothetical protein IPO21_20705 [Bacteroidales bacterium]|nr:hypothetical protein [Bacteroidales bacterium]
MKLIIVTILLIFSFNNNYSIELTYLTNEADVTYTHLEDWEAEFLVILNRERKKKGKVALTQDYKLDTAAYFHSYQMASLNFCDHRDFDIRAEKYGFLAENVAYNYNSAIEYFEAWKNSSSHKKNMFGNYSVTGISFIRKTSIKIIKDKNVTKKEIVFDETYATQLFK